MPEPRKTHVIPSNNAAPDAPLAEVRVLREYVIVTVSMPALHLVEASLSVKGTTLTVRSLPGQDVLQLNYPLPVETLQDAFVARELNGVWDISIMRSPRKSV